MFRRKDERTTVGGELTERVDSVVGPEISCQGQINGSGGIRIEGAFDGEIALRGIVVVGEKGRVSCRQIRALTVVVAGAVKGDILANKIEITRTGRVWGDVTTTSFSTEEGAFLRGQIRMEDSLDLGFGPQTAEASGQAVESS
jgi:cytoskeletal protein CcmA (bactofilin family)